jgi:DNA-binding CsgD family transcriptional regulator
MPTDHNPPKGRLTAREEELVLMSSEGKTDQEIAKSLGLSKYTVNSYWKRIMPKMGAASRTAAVATYWQKAPHPQDMVTVVSAPTESLHGPNSLSYSDVAVCLGNIRVFSARVLQSLITLSQAEFGFVGSIRHDPEGKPYLKEHAITDISWDDASRALFQHHFANGMEFRNLNTLFGEVMTTAEMVVSNNPAEDPRAGGLPHGHPPLHNFIGFPIHHRHGFVGMACLGNREGGFDPSLREEIEGVLNAYGAALSIHKETVATTESLHRTDLCSRLLASALEETDQGVLVEDETGTILFANETFCRLFGLSIPPECLYGLKCRDLLGRNVQTFDDPAAAIAFVSSCLNDRPAKAETLLLLKGGITCKLSYRHRTGKEDAGHCWVWTF